ncbi:hypothetical protein [Streptomyces chattanoogensis]|uniref:hypothetical protein n=1 Tax=Streptomyces chattanoogensis TaxID=66876 RepID=UPI0005D9F642|nr:hypothetical protein T261_2470 [Streptomyces lydicus]
MQPDAVQEWIAEHAASLSPAGLSAAFDAYLCTLPWAGAGIRWQGLPHRTLTLDADVTDEAVLAWARRTPVAAHAHVLVIDSAREPGVICRFEDGLRDFDLLSGRPDLFLCGVDLADGAPRPVFEHFIERRFFRTLTARLSG